MLNKVILIGNLGKDPEIRNTNQGKRVANFSIATSESWKDRQSGERKTSTEWHNVVVFNEGLVGVIEKYIHKGSKVYVEGKLKTRKWQDQDGKDRYTTEVVLQNYGGTLIMLDSKDGAQAQPVDPQAPNLGQPEGGAVADDDMPFMSLPSWY